VVIRSQPINELTVAREMAFAVVERRAGADDQQLAQVIPKAPLADSWGIPESLG
jgi:hypothetical protein